jgi:hypothetical protein
MNGIGERSCEPITPADLDRLAALAAADREARLTRRPRWSVSGDRIICVALHATPGAAAVISRPAARSSFRTQASVGESLRQTPAPDERQPSDPPAS